jgi:hypothetical protein
MDSIILILESFPSYITIALLGMKWLLAVDLEGGSVVLDS